MTILPPCEFVIGMIAGEPGSSCANWALSTIDAKDGLFGMNRGNRNVPLPGPLPCAAPLIWTSADCRSEQPPPYGIGSVTLPRYWFEAPMNSVVGTPPSALLSDTKKLTVPSVDWPCEPSLGTNPPVPLQPVPY